MVSRLKCASLALCMSLCFVAPANGENWPAWRGPRGDSTSLETGLPVVWNATTGVVWKAALPEWGTSTPAIWDDAIFLTAQEGERLLLVKLKKSAGQIEWTREVGTAAVPRAAVKPKSGDDRRAQKFHDLHNMDSPSPVTDGKLVVVHFGNGLMAAYDFAGEQKWRHDFQAEFGPYTIWWGHANSPVLYKNLVISVCMQDSLFGATEAGEEPSPSYVVAHHLQTGEQKWLSPRMTTATAEQCDAYTTPVFAQVAGRTEMIIMGGNVLDAYNPATGQQLWFLPKLTGGRTVTGPTVGEGFVFATQGQKGPLSAVKLGGSGELTSRDVAWKAEQGTPDSCCPVLGGGWLFTVGDDGIARCYDALSGHKQWQQRLKGDFKASPLVAEGRVYFLNTSGVSTVVSASNRFEKLAENHLDDTMLASPAASGGKLYLRGKKALYCLGAGP